MSQLASRVTATRQVSFYGSVVALNDAETGVQPAPVCVASQLLQSALVITVIGGLRSGQIVVTTVRVPVRSSETNRTHITDKIH